MIITEIWEGLQPWKYVIQDRETMKKQNSDKVQLQFFVTRLR